MDTSEEYIKMCDCPEVQSQWKLLMDEKAHPATDIHDYSTLIVREYKSKNERWGITLWLPRQDQIQEMLNAHYQKHLKLLYDFSLTVSWNINTPEQLWLAFYMYEKHKKTWNGKEWVKK